MVSATSETVAPSAATPRGTSRDPRTPLALAAVALVAAAAATAGLVDVPNLDDGDQKKTAQYLLHLWQGGSWALPMEQGSVLPTKPPLFVWLGAGAAWLTGGPTDLALRLPSAGAAVLLAVLTAHLGAMAAGAGAALGAGLAVVATPLFLKLSAFGRPDMVLCLCITAALWAAACVRAGVGPRGVLRALFWIALGLGVLAKGPVAPLVVLVALGLHGLWIGHVRGWRALRPGVGIPVFLAVVAAWFVPAVREGGEAFLRVQVVDEIVQRTVDPAARGARPHGAGAFLAETAGRFAPWTLFLPAAAAAAAPFLGRARGAKGDGGGGRVLPAAWLAGGLLVFLLPAQKRADYAMAFLPAAALLVGLAFAERDPSPWTRRLLAGGAGALAAAGAVLAAVQAAARGPLVTVEDLDPDAVVRFLLAAGVAAAGAGAAAAVLILRRRGPHGAAVLAGAALVLSVAASVVAGAPERAALRERRAFLQARAAEGVPVLAYRPGGGTGNSGELFYLRTAEPTLHAAEEVHRRRAREPGGRIRILTGERGAADLERAGAARRMDAPVPAGTGWVLLEAGGP